MVIVGEESVQISVQGVAGEEGNFSVIFHGSDASPSGFDLGAPPFHQGL